MVFMQEVATIRGKGWSGRSQSLEFGTAERERGCMQVKGGRAGGEGAGAGAGG